MLAPQQVNPKEAAKESRGRPQSPLVASAEAKPLLESNQAYSEASHETRTQKKERQVLNPNLPSLQNHLKKQKKQNHLAPLLPLF